MTISTEHLVEVKFERDHFPDNFISCESCANKIHLSRVFSDLKELTNSPENNFHLLMEPEIGTNFHGFKIQRKYWHDSLATYWKESFDFFCDWCVITCEDCDEVAPVNDAREVEGRYWVCGSCAENYSFCDNCDYMTKGHNLEEIDGGDFFYCSDCVSDYSYYCEGCDTRHRDSVVCEYSYEHDGAIHNYSFKPEPVFYGSDDQELFFGFELEVESKGNALSEGVDLVRSAWGDFVYFKADGSLEYGFEIVSHPFSFDHYRTINFEVLNDLRGLGFRSWDTETCGFHLHISKRGFSSNGHIWRFSNLIINNQREWAKLAGRTSEQWSSYSKNRNKIGKVLTGKEHPERYVAVNLCNWGTVEVRIFRGSLNVRRIASHIEAIYAAVQYTRNLSFSEVASEALRFDKFADWVNEVGDFGNFNDLLTAKKLINNSALAEN